MVVIDCINGPRQRFSVELLGQTWVMERYGDLEALWETMGQDQDLAHELFGQDERLPYWTELWPSSVLLGIWLEQQKERIHGHICLDMGCGLGFTALLGAHLGAEVLALDYEWPAVRFTAGNAALNQGKLAACVQPVQMDWRAPGIRKGRASFIWGADVMYEKRFVEPVAAFLRHCLAPGGVVWISEPQREIFRPFAVHMRATGWRCDKVREERLPHVTVRGPETGVNLWELARLGDA